MITLIGKNELPDFYEFAPSMNFGNFHKMAMMMAF